MNIDKLIENYKSYDELKLFCEAQFKQIQTLTKKNKDLQDKLDNKPVVTAEPSNLEISKDDAKVISEIQLAMLKLVAMGRELTTDEAKRVELYNRIIKDIEKSDNKAKEIVEKMPNGELLKLVE